MAVTVRLTSSDAAHLKRRAEQLGRRVMASGGGTKVEIQDGFIIRATGNRDRATVTVLAMDAQVASYGLQLFRVSTGSTLTMEARIGHHNTRGFMGRAARGAVDPGFLVVPPDLLKGVKDTREGIALGTPAAQGVTLQPGMVGHRHISSRAVTTAFGSTLALQDRLIISRSLAGQKWAQKPFPHDLIAIREPGFNGGTSQSEVLLVVIDRASIDPAMRGFLGHAMAAELSATVGLALVDLFSGEDGDTAASTRAIRYELDLEGSVVRVPWSVPLPPADGLTPYTLSATPELALAVLSRHTGADAAEPNVVVTRINPESGALSSAVLPMEGKCASHPWPVELGGQPYVVLPRSQGVFDSDADAYQFSRVRLDDLDALLVRPDMTTTRLDTPGYFLQPGTMDHSSMSASPPYRGAAYGSVITSDGAPYRGQYSHFDRFTAGSSGQARGCEYALGILAVVLIPNADFLADNMRRHLGLIRADTGALIYVSPEPFGPPGYIWMPTNLSCVELGEVDSGGAITKHAVLLVSSYTIPLAGEALPVNWSAVNAWITADGAQTMTPLYPSYPDVPAITRQQLPIANATYLGSPLLPAKIGQTRGQWS